MAAFLPAIRVTDPTKNEAAYSGSEAGFSPTTEGMSHVSGLAHPRYSQRANTC
jgi:hypothetical protein